MNFVPLMKVLFISVDERPDIKVQVVDWPKFDWNKFSKETEDVLGELYAKWEEQDLLQLDPEILVSVGLH